MLYKHIEYFRDRFGSFCPDPHLHIPSKESMRRERKRADENESTNDRRIGHATNERRSPLCKIRTAHSAPMTEMNPVRCGGKLLVLVSLAFWNFHLHSDDCLLLFTVCVCACVIVVLLSSCVCVSFVTFERGACV